MLIAVDVGNTNIVFGVFSGKKLVTSWRVETRSKPLYFQDVGNKAKSQIRAAIISSVVPNVDQHLTRQIEEAFGIKAVFVSAKNIPLKIKIRNKAEIGADRLVNAFAALKLYGAPSIVIDFGTATTFCALNGRGEYLGGAIAPGVALSARALHTGTAKLPLIEVKYAKGVIGKDTVSAMTSGLYYGYVAMVEGMVARMKKALSPKAKVIGTGGFSALLKKRTKVFDIVDPNLTLEGLRLIWEEMNT
jgi:type III pantothenate kinase